MKGSFTIIRRMKIDVYHVAKLANLPLAPGEEKKLEHELSETLAYIEHLNELKIDNVIPTSQVTGLENITRDDKTYLSLSQEDALKNAKSTYLGFFKVPSILEE